MITAKEFLSDTIPKDCIWEEMSNITNCPVEDIEKTMIEFAKLHVTEALRVASESTGLTYSKALWGNGMDVDRNAILNAYPLTNIK